MTPGPILPARELLGDMLMEFNMPKEALKEYEASMAKTFTAAALLRLVEHGRLSLDEPIARWFPELPDYGEPITVRRLMNHTSGLRDWGSVSG